MFPDPELVSVRSGPVQSGETRGFGLSSRSLVQTVWEVLSPLSIKWPALALHRLGLPGGWGALPLVGIHHVPVNKPRLFCIGLTLNAHCFTTLHPMTPYSCFWSKFFGKIIKFWKISQFKTKMYYKYTDFVQFHTQWPLFAYVTQ